MSLEYFIIVMYADNTVYTATIKNSKDIDKIPKKYYTAIKIFYNNNTAYSHVIYGNDYVYLDYDNVKGYLLKSQWDDNQEITTITVLKGIGKEETIKNICTEIIPKNKIFVGKLLPDDEYEKLRKQCEEWRPT